MTNTRPKIFISYSSKDRAYAERLVSSLLLNAVQVWYDQRDIEVGQPIHDRIHEGLLQADFLGLVLTPRSITSAWVKEELSLAKQRELEEHNVMILPLLFEQAALPLHLRSRKYADFSNFASGFRSLMRALNRTALITFDDSLRQRVLNAVSGRGSDAAVEIQTIRSQNAARLVRGTTLDLAQIPAQLGVEVIDDSGPAIVFVDIQSAGIEVPISVALSERCGSVLARVYKLLVWISWS